eukprot:scaffold2871_cov381-Prasinococcus_capsulatus_cf.AAC.16
MSLLYRASRFGLARCAVQHGLRVPYSASAAVPEAGSTAPVAAPPGPPPATRAFDLDEPTKPNWIYSETYCRQRQQMPISTGEPDVFVSAWVAPNATIVGDVDVLPYASVWYNTVLRGDLNKIQIGSYSNVQDNCVLHAARTSPTGLTAATLLGKYVSVFPGSVIRSTILKDECVVGAGCVLMEGSMVEDHAIVADGSVLPPGRRIPAGELWAGNPANFVRKLTKDEKEAIKHLAQHVCGTSGLHRDSELPWGTQYQAVEKLKDALAGK